MQISIKKIAEVLSLNPDNYNDSIVAGICTDSRTIKPNDCFIAINGETFDGNQYCIESLKKHAACTITDNQSLAKDNPSLADRIITVKNTIKAMAILANWYRLTLNAKVIAITGSAGKTSTRQIIAHVLGTKYKIYQAPGSFNNNIGLPTTIFGADQSTEILITEIGTNHPGEIQELTKIALPDIALVNNAFPAHLEGFGSIDAIRKEKLSIHNGLNTKGTLIINESLKDFPQYLNNLKSPPITFGESPTSNIYTTKMQTDGMTGSITINNHEIQIPLPGKASLINALAAWAICSQFDISIDEFKKAISTFKTNSMRMEIIRKKQITIIKDCYNANPASMQNALDCLAKIKHNHRTVFIAGQMGELGDDTNKFHTELGQYTAKLNINLLLACGKSAKYTTDAAIKTTTLHDFKAYNFENTTKLCDNLHELVKPDDIILIKGSRSAALEAAADKLDQLFE